MSGEKTEGASGAPAGERIEHTDYAARSRATQQRLLDVAVEVLVEHGYSGASTLRIQQRAGVSRGRLLHQYPHRDALLVAAVQHIAEARMGLVTDPVVAMSDPAERVVAAIDAMWSNYQADYFWAATELWLASRHNASLAEALAPREQALGAMIRQNVDAMFGPELVAHPSYPALRELLTSSMRGVALTYSFDPRDPLTDPHLPGWRATALRELDLEG